MRDLLRIGKKIRKMGYLLGALILVLPLFVSPGESKTNSYNHKPIQGMPTMLDLGAKTCIPCRMMAPILKKLEREYRGKADVIFIDVIKNPIKAKKFGIRTIPTQIFFDRNGLEVMRHEGFMNEASIVRILELLVESVPHNTMIEKINTAGINAKSLNGPRTVIIFVAGGLILFLIIGVVFVKSSRSFKE